MKYFATIIFIFILSKGSFSQDTFSIVAVDPVTGEVGSAGASCVANCIILSDVHPGYGVVHTQASYLSSNQNYARYLMNQGYPPQQIIDSMIARDAQNNPSIRQYGIVDLINGGRTAAYTGANCLNYKNHILGPTYSIQGNILLGQQILDSMQSRFLNTQGTLAQKLMAALQGAKVIGADTRCTGRGTSSISAFLRVARSGDTLGNYHINLNVGNTPSGRDPIDSLQILFNGLTGINFISGSIPDNFSLYQNFPNPFNPVTTILFDIQKESDAVLKIYNSAGKEVAVLVDSHIIPGRYSIVWNSEGFPSGIYYYSLKAGEFSETKKMILVK